MESKLTRRQRAEQLLEIGRRLGDDEAQDMAQESRVMLGLPADGPAANDQIRAAAKEAEGPLLEQFREAFSKEATLTAATDPLLAVLLLLAVGDRCMTTCRHWNVGKFNIGMGGFTAFLGPGVCACAPCIRPLLLGMEDQDDGRCDLCDEPSKLFTPFATILGGLTIHGDHGECCDKLFAEARNG